MTCINSHHGPREIKFRGVMLLLMTRNFAIREVRILIRFAIKCNDEVVSSITLNFDGSSFNTRLDNAQMILGIKDFFLYSNY